MPAPAFEIRPFAKDASRTDYAALNRHNNRMRKERLPDDPPIPLEETIQNLHSMPPFVDLRLWAAWNAEGSEIVGLGDVVLLRLEENRRLAQFEITVEADYRRQGLGRRLLRLIAEAAEQDERSLLMTSTVDRVPAGEAFMLRLGVKKGLEAHTNQLRLADLEHGLLRRWIEQGEQNRELFELGFWDGPYPEERLAAIVELYDLTNQQPHGELEVEDMHLTPEQVRQVEQNIFARGNQRWTAYVLDRGTGGFAGYSETVWNPNRPEILRQDMTGVFPHYRGRGLGRWLKAAMLERVLRERPEVKYVRTGNADSNAAMLKINTELGFQPYTADALWQVELQQVFAYLNTHAKEESHA